jgi:protein phosphatase
MPEALERHPTLATQAAGGTDIGRVRDHNEDAILVRPDLRLWVVCDGAGGHNAGNVASAIAVSSIAEHFESTERAYRETPDIDRFGVAAGARRLSAAIRKANRDVVEVSKSSQRFGGMGSTVVAATVAARSPTLHVAHVGDSRCYRLRDGRLERLTHDHSLLNDVIEMHPDIADEAMAKLPRKVVTRALGMEESVRPAVRSFAVAADDLYLLCSDGLTGELTDEQIRAVLVLPLPPAQLVEQLIARANEVGGGDNIAAVVLSCDFAPAPSEDLASLLEPDSPPRPATLAPPRSAPRPESAPEILLLGIESELDAEEAPAIRVVPESSASSGLFRAIGDLLPQRRPRGPVSLCGSCGAELVTEAIFCPRCGTRRVQS